MKPGDMIFYRDVRNGCHRLYEVEGVHLGGTGVCGVIAIRPLTEKPGRDVDGNLLPVMYVPEPLLRNAEVFSRAYEEANTAYETAALQLKREK